MRPSLLIEIREFLGSLEVTGFGNVKGAVCRAFLLGSG
jgi:hypothetical protein